ncbi:sugar transferase [Kangiella sp. TOML190]|uniref:sugar transferase n=1 Tax=Kangiella sp. TOML190 TaxID=2931351 RepID=UPI00203D0D9B|nr:sugar transferase [Kangiella sp. TOML190]
MSFYKGSAKRCLDISMSLLSLILLLPLILLMSLLILLFDFGPIIFKQVRVGQYGKPFVFYKFRSMPVNTGDIPSDQIKEIKITWIGKLIRRTNIDEIPQLFNILKGDMSIVGPRPSIKNQVKLIELREQSGALECKPGLTGLAQIKSYDGMPTEDKAAFDSEYAAKITFMNDLKIVLRTFLYLLKPPPVY